MDDAQPYETEVAHLPISEPGYYFSVEVDGEKLAKPSDDEDWELDSSADNDEDWEEDSPTDDAEIQPCDESERMLTTEADEVKGLREGTFSGSSPQACDLCGRDLTVRKYYLNARHRGKLLWSNMCSQCFLGVGEGIGWGKGQLFSRQPDGKWLQVGGFRPSDDE